MINPAMVLNGKHWESPAFEWDYIKHNICKITIKFIKNLVPSRRRREKNPIKLINSLER